MALRLVTRESDVSYDREPFPLKLPVPWNYLFAAHGSEVRGRPLNLDLTRYQRLEREGRLVWIVARSGVFPIGYSGHYWYYDLHFCDEKIAADDLWYVEPVHRGRGIGRRLKEIGLAALRAQGVKCSYDLVRIGGSGGFIAAASPLIKLGYEAARMQWKIEL